MRAWKWAVLAVPVLVLAVLLWLGVLGRRQSPAAPAKEVVDSIGMRLVRIGAGEFLMGCEEPAEQLLKVFPAHKRTPDDIKEEFPRHRVRITRPFFIGKYEVTVGEYRQFVEDTGYKTEPETDGQGGWGYNSEVRKCEGRKPHFNWHSTGFVQSDQHPVVNLDLIVAEPGPDSFTVPVGRYKPNAWGLHDMHGNVWEWCSDWQDDDYYAQSPLEDPQGPEKSNVRVRRGGGWNTFPIWARASFRNFNTPVSRLCNLGFRVVREIPVADSPPLKSAAGRGRGAAARRH